MLPEAPDEKKIDVIVARNRGPRVGIRPHRTSRLDPVDIKEIDGLPITSPARTVLDVSELFSSRGLGDVLEEAFRRKLVSAKELRDVINLYPGRRGARLLAALLDECSESDFTYRGAERKLRALIKAAELPRPRFNLRMHGYQVDVAWLDQRLVIEVDSRRFHSSARQFETDRRKAARLTAAGFTVIRVTWHQLKYEPMAVVARIARTLGRLEEASALGRLEEASALGAAGGGKRAGSSLGATPAR
jgi:very-short-patch-repair endonuclease